MLTNNKSNLTIIPINYSLDFYRYKIFFCLCLIDENNLFICVSIIVEVN